MEKKSVAPLDLAGAFAAKIFLAVRIGLGESLQGRRFVMAVILSAVWGMARGQIGFDTGLTASATLERFAARPEFSKISGTHAWLRVRDLTEATSADAVAREREALRELRRFGYRICALVEWDGRTWTGGVRDGGGRRLPLDLREAWTRARILAREFSACVDLWEIGNEPDISFVEENPETYVAYFKACRAGLRVGAADVAERQPRVVMAPLALPPGPYFERVWENGLGRLTEGVNFHFYGYAEEFSDVYRQFRDAVVRPTGGAAVEDTSVRELPVYLTEYGYGLMDAMTGARREGRLRQWRWFCDVGTQLKMLRPEGAMAFVLAPYLEQGLSEFGLFMNAERSNAPLVFQSEDFGPDGDATALAKLMGESVDEWRMSPALVWLLRSERAGKERSSTWRVRGVEDNSPLVLDFVARDGLEQRKSFLGYFARGVSTEGKSSGWGELVLYNFSLEKIAGVLALGDGLTAEGSGVLPIELEPGERRAVTVKVERRAAIFQGTPSRTVFSNARGICGQLVTTFWPDPMVTTPRIVADFAGSERMTAARAERLLTRPRASEEPALAHDGRWLVSSGMSVGENDGVWTFTVAALPTEPLRPAMAELPLPEGFVFEAGTLLEFSYRLAEGSAEKVAWFDVYFRTENGNLYQVWPRQQADGEWRGYAEAAENFTMAFYGRAKLPWRFVENRPAALVFFLRPEKMPAIFQIKDAAITRRVVE